MSKSFLLSIAAVSALTATCGFVLAAASAPSPPATAPAATAPSTAPATAPARVRGGGGENEGEGGGRAAGGPTVGGVRGGRGAAAPAGLENTMSDMNRTLTALKRDSADPANSEQTLRDLYTLERDVAIAKLLAPPSTNRMSGDDKTKAIDSYRAMMTMLTKQLLDLEDAVDLKKADDIKKGIAELEQIEQQGHTEFNVRPDGD